MALTEIQIRQAKAKEKDYKLHDEKGLFLLVKTTDARYWRFKYRFTGKEKLLALGVYPSVSLKKARQKTHDARKQRDNDIDPGLLKKTRKMSLVEAAANTFQEIALEWYAKESPNWSEAHREKQKWLLQKNLFPYIGKNPIKDISPPVLLAALRKIESRGALETTRRAKQVSGQIFRYAVVTGRAERDPSADIKGALKTPQTRHFSAITDPVRVGQLLRAIDDYHGSVTVRAALKACATGLCKTRRTTANGVGRS